MFSRLRSRFTRRRGRTHGGILPLGGGPKRCAYIDTKPRTGTSVLIDPRVEAFSSSWAPGYLPVDMVTPPTLHPASSYGALTSSGPGTAAVGESGRPPERAA